MNNEFYMDFDRQIFISDRILEEPYIFDFTKQNIKEGYAAKEHLVTLFTISEMIGGEVSLFLNGEPNFNIEHYSRIIRVPFQITTGEIFIYSYFDDEELSEEEKSFLNDFIRKGYIKEKEYKPKKFTMENGDYELYFAIKGKGVTPDTEENEYEIYFVTNQKPTFKSILRDEW